MASIEQPQPTADAQTGEDTTMRDANAEADVGQQEEQGAARQAAAESPLAETPAAAETAEDASGSNEVAQAAQAQTPPEASEDTTMADATVEADAENAQEEQSARSQAMAEALPAETPAAAETAEEAGGPAEATQAIEAQVPPEARTDAQPAGEEQTSQAMEEAKVDPKTPPAKSRRTKTSSSKTSPLEAAAAMMKARTEEAERAEAAIAEEVKKVDDFKANVAKFEAVIVDMRAAAQAKRAAVQKASQDFLRHQSQASIAHLEACIPKKPCTAFFMFRADNCVKGMPTDKQSKLISEKWASASEEEKKRYQDKWAAAQSKYKEWSTSEDGQKNLAERQELIRQCRVANKEGLDKALQTMEPSRAEKTTKSAPSKRAKGDVEKDASPETPAKELGPERPAKQPRVVAAKVSSKEPFLDEQVLEEAGKAELVAQLRNLAARPEVMALGKSSQELLDVLKAKNGIVNAAKHALLSA